MTALGLIEVPFLSVAALVADAAAKAARASVLGLEETPCGVDRAASKVRLLAG